MTAMPRVQEINDPGRLAKFRPLWNRLLAETPGATFFQSHDWLECYWRHYGAGQRLRVLVVYGHDGPLGILPLVVWTERSRAGEIRVARLSAPRLGNILWPHRPESGRDAPGRAPARPPDPPRLGRPRSPLGRSGRLRSRPRLGGRCKRPGLHPRGAGVDRAPRIEITGTWQDYLSGRDNKFRHNIERCQRRLAEQGEVALVCHRPLPAAQGDGDPRWDLYDACVDLARRSWQGERRRRHNPLAPGDARFPPRTFTPRLPGRAPST